MLQQRSEHVTHPLTWSFWGGKSESDERPIETLLRECREEMGVLPDIEKVYPIHQFTSDDGNFQYNTFCVTVFEEFLSTTLRKSVLNDIRKSSDLLSSTPCNTYDGKNIKLPSTGLNLLALT
jgi:8-oxo-dGTP pyrophosphatase MutT (NUDIX family)